jgi:hypothetical protein
MAVVLNPQCSVPVSTSLPVSQVSATADRIDLSAPKNTRVQIGSPGVSEDWLLDWLRLFTEHLPPCKSCGTTQMHGSIVYLGGADADAGRWQGSVEGLIPSALDRDNPDSGHLNLVIAGAGDDFLIEPINLVPAGKPPLTLSGSFDKNGYTLNLIGTATEAQMKSLQTTLPPLGTGLVSLLPDLFPVATKTAKVNLLCSRKWAAEETCATLPMEITPSKSSRPRHAGKSVER